MCPLSDCLTFGSWLESVGYIYSGSARETFANFPEDFAFVSNAVTGSSRFQLPGNRSWNFTRERVYVTLIGSLTSPIADVLSYSRSTFDMIFITHAHAYCLFPQSNLNHRQYYRCKAQLRYGNTDDIRQFVRYLKDIGTPSQALPSPKDICLVGREFSFQRRRSINDDFTLKIALTGTNGDESEEDHVSINSWSIRYGADWITMILRNMRAGNLDFQYCVSPELQFFLNSKCNKGTFLAEWQKISNSIKHPRHSDLVSNLVQHLVRSEETNPNFSAYDKSYLLDGFTIMHIFAILQEIEKKHETLFMHYYDYDDYGKLWLNVKFHVILYQGQPPNEFRCWNTTCDLIAKERVALRFEWSESKY
ncbi:hypothetical protein GYMLUDRAFT_57345 [Collybiopsis luxurians FD-317 M1]|uniref:Uncharacterized protein n=1 Tax=Collybiopsis luxurians FD-317 M1 TaxID=944289 RepID=A0A0D0BI23_9AGAR|nr:hypothetical protein GYMLUDRAFT_57345 [Collybiopsis luxurians FD-317 M1]